MRLTLNEHHRNMWQAVDPFSGWIVRIPGQAPGTCGQGFYSRNCGIARLQQKSRRVTRHNSVAKTDVKRSSNTLQPSWWSQEKYNLVTAVRTTRTTGDHKRCDMERCQKGRHVAYPCLDNMA